jgi:DnaK suppressor protein
LLKRLGADFRDLGQSQITATGDSADAAFDAGSEEMASHLAELEAKELNQIQRALVRLKQGTYGQCEACQVKIQVARLNALPYSTLCIKCQREMESGSDWDAGRIADWDRVSDNDRSEDRRELRLADLEMDLSK